MIFTVSDGISRMLLYQMGYQVFIEEYKTHGFLRCTTLLLLLLLLEVFPAGLFNTYLQVIN